MGFSWEIMNSKWCFLTMVLIANLFVYCFYVFPIALSHEQTLYKSAMNMKTKYEWTKLL